MPPNTYDRPASRDESIVVGSVTGDVPLELRLPVTLIDARLCAVLGAAVPEAAVHEHCHPRAGEDDVRAGARCERLGAGADDLSVACPDIVSPTVARLLEPCCSHSEALW